MKATSMTRKRKTQRRPKTGASSAKHRARRSAAGRGTTSLPFVLINMAITADGKIATANRGISSFGSPRDHEHLLELRATADAVMAGARTVDSADVTMGPGPARHRRLRLKRGLAEYNIRVVVSRTGSVDLDAALFTQRLEARRLSATNAPSGPKAALAASPLIILTTRLAGAKRLMRLRALADEVKVLGAREIDFRKALRWLRDRWNVRRLLCEGGGELNDALFRSGVVNELHLTVCPKLFGGRNAPTISDGAGFGRLAHAARFRLASMKRVRGELFLRFTSLPHPTN
jgi:riboflavin-specific deaminase-like protein